MKQLLAYSLAIILVLFLAFQPIAASNDDNGVVRSSSKNWWELHPRWSQGIARTTSLEGSNQEFNWWNKKFELREEEKSEENSWWDDSKRWQEFKAGSLGGLVGGISSSVLLGLLSYQYYSNSEERYDHSFGAPGLAISFGIGFGYPVGSALGSATSVWATGKNLGETGNPVSTYLGAGIAAGLSFWGISFLEHSLYERQNFFHSSPIGTFFLKTVSFITGIIALATPAVASFGATFSYNLGNTANSNDSAEK